MGLKDRFKKDGEEKPVKEKKPKKEKPAKEPKARKEKPAKEPKEKAPKKLGNPFKKAKGDGQDEGLDILTDVKEPFSFSNFFEKHVVEPAKRAKNTLAERGVLFFLFSPFQARARLIAQLFILCIGVMFGVVPRASSLVSALQDQAYASEIAGLKEKTVGSITLTPAASSNYKRNHMIAFVVEGKNLPSDANKYDVHLARGYGASDWADVTYSWSMYPVDDDRRILLVSIDQTKQASGYGAFDLYIQLAGEEVPEYAKDPFEITLSAAQETQALYDKNGIHLSALTEAICGTGDIEKKQAALDEALEKYAIAVEQAEKMPVDIEVEPTRDKLEAYCLSKRVYRDLNDHSTTEDILKIEQVAEAPELTYGTVIKSGGIEYNKEFVEQLRSEGGYSDEDAIRFTAFDSVDSAKDAVLAAMGGVNNSAMSWYSTLMSYRLILNQTIKEKTFPLYARCTNTIEDEIEFIDPDAEEPDDEEDTGLSGTMTGDDPDIKPQPSGGDDEPAKEDPPVTEEPVEEDPEPEEPAEEDPEPEEPTEEEPEEEEPVVEEPKQEEPKQEEEPVQEEPKQEEKKPESTDTGKTQTGGITFVRPSGEPADNK